MAWRPTTLDVVQRIVAEQLLACTPAQRAMFGRIRITPRRLPILRGNSIEHVFAVAELPEDLVFWDDVEEGFELAKPDADGTLRDYGAGQLELTHVLEQLLERERPTGERILFRGRRVLPNWPETLEAAQAITTYAIDGVDYPRIRFGEEPDDRAADRGPCHDCVARKGEFHVPGCDVERCPACAGQAISCDCNRDDRT